MSAPGPGRGRGEGSKIARIDEGTTSTAQVPVLGADGNTSSSSQTSGSSSNGDKTVRGRGGYRSDERNIIPKGVTQTKSDTSADGSKVKLLSNFVRITPMKEEQIFGYRVDYTPDIEDVRVRRNLFNSLTADVFQRRVIFDGVHDAKSKIKTGQEKIEKQTEDPTRPNTKVTLTLKLTGPINFAPFEKLRVYSTQMKNFLRKLGFYALGGVGAYVHPGMTQSISDNLNLVRGFKTAAHIHESGTLMLVEACHKLMQKSNILAMMRQIREQSRGGNLKELIKSVLSNKIVVTSYNNEVYRVEDVNFDVSPSSTFFDRRANADITYAEYYRRRYNKEIQDTNQPLLRVVSNRRARQEQAGGDTHDIYLIPELCLMAGLTEQQRTDNRLKMELIRTSQVSPVDKVKHLEEFLRRFHGNQDINEMLTNWGYTYAKELVSLPARIIPMERIATGKTKNDKNSWAQADGASASFDRIILSDSRLCVPPKFGKLAIMVPKILARDEDQIVGGLRRGFDKIGLTPESVIFVRMDRDSAADYVSYLRNISADVSAVVILLPNINKERYDACKKLASVERGIITQVVTGRLMTDQKKAGGAAVKIAIQIAAKLGGEPWYGNIPLRGSMICGYDTYHDTASSGGRSFGAFVASMNDTYSRWWSKADSHDRLDELSAHLAENFTNAVREYRKKNGAFPTRIIIYRDGVSEGQVDHVFDVEVKHVEKALKQFDERIMLTYVIVNKRIGARFFLKNAGSYINCPPGTVIDDIVTRKNAYDFYLVSQSTRHGTITPTYYTIIYDTSGLSADKHQMLAYKMCFMYYNWTGTVRVPAPCQYAHKLALLCGENLHNVPNAVLDDRLHFL